MLNLATLLCSLLVTTLALSPALHADDTEVFFGQGGSGTDVNQNVLFVLDTSGSMNWYDSGQSGTRLERLKEAMNSMIDSSTNINVGLMRFNGLEGGSAVIYPISPIDKELCSNGCGIKTHKNNLTGNSNGMQQNVASGAMSSGTTHLNLGGNGNDAELAGLRFDSVNVPSGVTITDARIEFTSQSTLSDAAEFHIVGQDIDDAPVISTSAYSLSNASATSASVSWTPTAWNIGDSYSSPDLSSIVQEIVGRPGWCGSQSMMFIVGGTGQRTSYSFDDTPSKAPKLRISYDTNNIPAGKGCVERTTPAEIVSGVDDAEETSGSINTNSYYLNFAQNTYTKARLRFQDLKVPAGATIISASIAMTANGNRTGSLTIDIHAEDSDNAEPQQSSWYWIRNRPNLAGGPVKWNIGSYDVGTNEEQYSTPDLTNLVQTIVSKGGWQYGNSIAFKLNKSSSGYGLRSFLSFERNQTLALRAAPLLSVTYRINLGDPTPRIWTYCAGENGTCTLSEDADVRYGANGYFYEKSFVAGNVSCSNAEFGDPINGTYKTCSYSGPDDIAESPGVFTVRDELKQVVSKMTATGGTPIVGSLYEAAQYMLGGPVYYGKQRGFNTQKSRYHRVSHPDSYTGGFTSSEDGCTDEYLDDPLCKSETIIGDPQYISQVEYACQTSNIVLLSDGEATSNSAISRVKNLTGNAICNPNVGNQACGPELADWLFSNDHNTGDALNQNISTYTIGFNVQNQFLKNIAAAGGGTYNDASSADELSTVFDSIIGEAKAVNTSFVAPTTTVNQFNRLTNRQDIYYALFKPKARPHWAGNLKRYAGKVTSDGQIEIVDRNDNPAIDPVSGFFRESASSWWNTVTDGPDVELGGAASRLSLTSLFDAGERRVFTYLSSASGASTDLTNSQHRLHEANTGITAEMLNATSTSERSSLLQWARGVDVSDVDLDGNLTDIRLQMGDALHSQPIVLNYANGSGTSSTVFMATNEGLLHAIDSENGDELYAFMPKDLLGNIKPLVNNQRITEHPYGLDGDLTVWHDDTNKNFVVDSNESAYLFIGMRRGGKIYYALDVSDRSAPHFLWKIEGGQGDFSQLAQTWSRPVPTSIFRNGVKRNVLIFGGGYDADNNDPNGTNLQSEQSTDNVGAAIFIVDALTGQRLWSGSRSPGDDKRFNDMNYSFPADIRVVDIDSNGLADQMYVGDMGGQLWRFDFEPYHQSGDLVYGGVIADLNGSGIANARRLYNEPDVAVISDNGKKSLAISIGSGWRAHPLNLDVNDRFYMIRQSSVYTRPSEYGKNMGTENSASWHPITESDLSDVSDDIHADYNPWGWFISMEDNGEKVLGSSITVNNQVVFTSFVPEKPTEPCSPAVGGGAVYVLDVRNGSPAVNLYDDGDDDDAELTKNDRRRFLKQPGIPPSASTMIMTGTNTDGSESIATAVMAGTEQVDVGLINLTRRTYWQDRGRGAAGTPLTTADSDD
ncbi:MAG: PilC/PilY family type IV pilus protein [Granulosicoccus sp.]